MSDLMRGIVEEALGRSRRKSGNDAAMSGAGLPGSLHRPNWQQTNRHRRLQAVGHAVQTEPALTGNSGRTAPTDGGQREFVEQTLSPLLRLMMVQGRTEGEPQPCSQSENECGKTSGKAGMIDRLDGGFRCWFYPDLTPRLLTEFGLRYARPISVGVVTAETGSPRPLFVLDEILKSGSADAEADVSRSEGMLEVRVIGKNRDKVQEVLERMSRELSRQAGDGPRILTALEPSTMLTRALDVAANEAVTVFDGLNRHRSIALLDRAFKADPDLDIRYRIEPSYLLIHGTRDQLEAATRLMKRDAEPYLMKE